MVNPALTHRPHLSLATIQSAATYLLVQAPYKDLDHLAHLVNYRGSKGSEAGLIATVTPNDTHGGKDLKVFRRDLRPLTDDDKAIADEIYASHLQKNWPDPFPILDGRRVFALSSHQGYVFLTHAVGPTVQYAEENAIGNVSESWWAANKDKLREGNYGISVVRGTFQEIVRVFDILDVPSGRTQTFIRTWLEVNPE